MNSEALNKRFCTVNETLIDVPWYGESAFGVAVTVNTSPAFFALWDAEITKYFESKLRVVVVVKPPTVVFSVNWIPVADNLTAFSSLDVAFSS